MADALVSIMLKRLATVIEENVHQEVNLVVGAKKEIEKLATTFEKIQAVLNDAELRQIKDEAVKLWLDEFKDIAYDMDDVLDKWSYEMHRLQTETGDGNNKKKVISSYLCSLCSSFSKVSLRHNIGTKIKDIKKRLDQVESDRHKYQFIKTTDEKPIQRLKSSSLVNVSDVLGRVIDKETIMSKLMFQLGESSTGTNRPESSSTQAALNALNIISIVGMGGLGKTTLAQLVFNDDQVKTHFEITMWVCVSDPFDLVTVTKAIIEEAKCKVPKSSEWNTLHHSLSESIKGKRFLLVLDDVWTKDRSIWEQLEVCFRNGAKGSRVLVTTRNEEVALMMNATYTHLLGVLSDDDCSSLLNRIALAGEKKENHEEFRKIGEKISKRCNGLPLAAKTLGGLLHLKNNKREWLSILDNEIWKLEDVENGFLKPALLLSYYDLPLPLKRCFIYCSIFPKDYEIEKDVLIKLWMAQGFLKSTSGNEELEMIGDDYFNNLAMRSFFQNFSKDDDNVNIISCQMHDLVHDFAQFLTKNECSLTQNSGIQSLNSSSKIRHLTVVCVSEEVASPAYSYDYFTSLFYSGKKLRTLQIINGYNLLRMKEVHTDLLGHLRCLKVLCLKDIGLKNLSSEIGNLIHLRYLDLSRNDELKILPETISNLYNLQTLKLEYCSSLRELPREIWRMINLRHLDIFATDQLNHIPQGIGRLTSLRTLSDFIVGCASESDFSASESDFSASESDFIVGGASEGCKIGELKNLNLLQGNLSIRGLGRVETVNEAFEIEMKKKQLHSLVLDFKPNEETENELEQNLLSKRMEDVLEVLEPHPEVVEIGVNHYLGFKLSRWIGNTSILSHMKTLELHKCMNLTKFPALGELPSLEVLHISGAIKVKHIGFEFYSNSLEHGNMVAFPKLKELFMQGMNNLEEWELKHGVVMPSLISIELLSCRKLKTLPALGKLQSLEKLYIQEADELRHIGPEFLYEVDEAGGELFNNIAFPKLETLEILWSKTLEWEFGEVGNRGEDIIMPCLRELSIPGLKNSKPILEILSKISSLESLRINGEATEFINYIRRHDDDDIDDDLHIASEIIFPNLKKLEIIFPDVEEMDREDTEEDMEEDMEDTEELEELKIGFQVMPLLKHLEIRNWNKLKAIQGLSSKLEKLYLYGCSSLYELPFPNLKRLYLQESIHPSLPEAFATTLQALEELTIASCPTLTCIPVQIQQLTNLKNLSLWGDCSRLFPRCKKDEGEDWRIISHIPNIFFNGEIYISNYSERQFL